MRDPRIGKITATGSTVVHSVRLVSGGLIVDDAWVRFDDATVIDRGTGQGWRTHQPTDVVDGSGGILTPGFIDLHCHGGGGASVDDGNDAIRRVLDAHAAHGTTRSVLSLVSADIDSLLRRIASIDEARARDHRILGAHLEGPFLGQDFRGAHDPRVLHDPEPGIVHRLIEAGGECLVQITIDPARQGALEAVDTFVAAGVVVAVGHTSADHNLACAAFDRGATLLTHAFNGMPGIHHRAPGPVLAAVSTPGVALEAILDGHHLHPAVVRMLSDLAPGRIALVTDAMAAAASEDGAYVLGGLPVTVSGGVARLSAAGTIAGSTLTQNAALRRALNDVGIPLADAVTALTETPARVLGLEHQLGRLDPGFDADAVLIRPNFKVDAVWVRGRRHR